MKNTKETIGMFSFTSSDPKNNTVEKLVKVNGKFFVEFFCGENSNRKIGNKNISKIGSGKIELKTASSIMNWSNNTKYMFRNAK